MDKITEKLQALADLQMVDSELDRIMVLRGSLPEEVADLEDDVQGLVARKDRIADDIKEIEGEISNRNINIKEYAEAIKRYEEQMDRVKNNREYEALQKEIEFANLEILTSEKKIKQFRDQIEGKTGLMTETQALVDERKVDLEAKRQELEDIVKQTEIQEKKLREKSEKAAKKVDERVLKGYKKIRFNVRNGLAVVNTDREACGGCFAIIPPQVQLEIRQKKRLIICENCGRMLVDRSFFGEVEEVVESAI